MNRTQRNKLLTIFYETRELMEDLYQGTKNKQRRNYDLYRDKIDQCRKRLLEADRILQNK